MTDPVVLKHSYDVLRGMLAKSRKLQARLQRELVHGHFGTYVVTRVDTGEFWIEDTKAGARVRTVQITCDHPELSAATVSYMQVAGGLFVDFRPRIAYIAWAS